jgi:folate-binding protein YgfZ
LQRSCTRSASSRRRSPNAEAAGARTSAVADTIPNETAQEARMVSFTKGCYLGQEIVLRIREQGVPARYLRGLHLEGPWLHVDKRGAHDASSLSAPPVGAGEGGGELPGGRGEGRQGVEAGFTEHLGGRGGGGRNKIRARDGAEPGAPSFAQLETGVGAEGDEHAQGQGPGEFVAAEPEVAAVV